MSILRRRARAGGGPFGRVHNPCPESPSSGGRRSNVCELDGAGSNDSGHQGWAAQPGWLLNRDSEASDVGTPPTAPVPRPGAHRACSAPIRSGFCTVPRHRPERDRLGAQRWDDKRTSAEATQRRVEWERDQRRDALSNLLAEQWRTEHLVTMYNQVGSGPEPEPDWTEPMARQLVLVRIFGSKEAFRAGEALVGSCQVLIADFFRTSFGSPVC
jgi:hypothetical protein